MIVGVENVELAKESGGVAADMAKFGIRQSSLRLLNVGYLVDHELLGLVHEMSHADGDRETGKSDRRVGSLNSCSRLALLLHLAVILTHVNEI